jgi:5'-3' exonuclease
MGAATAPSWASGLLVLCVVLLLAPYSRGGVPGLNRFLKRTSPASFKEVKASEGVVVVDHLCLDMNQMVHGGARKSATHTIMSMYKELDRVLMTFVPTKSIVFAFDGPAPFAKLQTQRNRRTDSPENGLITPGTDFMESMEDVMLCYVLQRANRPLFKDINVYISGPSIPGEGELKIINWMNTELVREEDSVAIHGSDSDIILQSMGLIKVKNVLVSQRENAVCVASVLESVYDYIHPINDTATIQSTPQRPSAALAQHASTEVSDTFRLDLLVLFAFQGNDYLSKLRCINFEDTLKNYGKVMSQLPAEKRFLYDLKTRTFNFEALWMLMQSVRKEKVAMYVALDDAVNRLTTMYAKRYPPTLTSVPFPSFEYDKVDDASGACHYRARILIGDTEYSLPKGL